MRCWQFLLLTFQEVLFGEWGVLACTTRQGIPGFAIICSYIQYIWQQLSCLLPFANLSICSQKLSMKWKVHKTICYLLTVTSSILSAYLFAYNGTGGLKLERRGREEIACRFRWWHCGQPRSKWKNFKSCSTQPVPNNAQRGLRLLLKNIAGFLWSNFH